MNTLLPLPSSVLGHVAQSYRRTAVQTAGPAQLIVEVHDAALTNVLQRANDAASDAALLRAHALVSELQSALCAEHDKALVQELSAFYDTVLQMLVDAYVQSSTAALPSVAAALRELRTAWCQLSDPNALG